MIKVNYAGLLGAVTHPLLFRLDPERAHEWAIWALRTIPLPVIGLDDPGLAVSIMGLNFRNPLGLAAGFDKNAKVINSILRLGFGFTEVGTVTPRPQPGNPRPRLFRLTRDQAVINRLGFCGDGFAAVHERLVSRPQRAGITGVNIGANRDSTNRADDYVRGIKTFAGAADYFTINVSSPNTPGLRDMQRPQVLDDVLMRVLAARDAQAQKFGRKPVLLKIAPDLALTELDAIIACARKRKIDGLIVSNTTISRPASLKDSAKGEEGGLSGRPLFGLSTQMLAAAYLRVENQFPLIGVGGIDSAESAFAKIEAGATLLQLYTSFLYKGLGLPEKIKHGLLRLLAQKSYPRLTDAIGVAAADWANGTFSVDNFRYRQSWLRPRER